MIHTAYSAGGEAGRAAAGGPGTMRDGARRGDRQGERPTAGAPRRAHLTGRESMRGAGERRRARGGRGVDQAGELDGPAGGPSDLVAGSDQTGGIVRGHPTRARGMVGASVLDVSRQRAPDPTTGAGRRGAGRHPHTRAGRQAVRRGQAPACGDASTSPGGGGPRGGPPGAARGSLIHARIFGGVDALFPTRHAVGLSMAPGGCDG